MATPRTWLGRAEEILEVLQEMRSPKIDRPGIEELFQLQRRAAITLMKQAGATGCRGSEFLVDRRTLIKWVENIYRIEGSVLDRRKAANEELSRVMDEVQTVRARLRQQGRPLVSFTLPDEVMRAQFSSLPSSIRVELGRIIVDFPPDDPEQAVRLLYELSIAMANDFQTFREIGGNHLGSAGSVIDELLRDLDGAKQSGNAKPPRPILTS